MTNKLIAFMTISFLLFSKTSFSAQSTLMPICHDKKKNKKYALQSLTLDSETLNDEILIPQEEYLDILNECSSSLNINSKNITLLSKQEFPTTVKDKKHLYKLKILKSYLDYPLSFFDQDNWSNDRKELSFHKVNLLKNGQIKDYKELNSLPTTKMRISEMKKSLISQETSQTSQETNQTDIQKNFMSMNCSYYNKNFQEKKVTLKENFYNNDKASGELDIDLGLFILDENAYFEYFLKCQEKVDSLKGTFTGMYVKNSYVPIFTSMIPVTSYERLAADEGNGLQFTEVPPANFWSTHKRTIIITGVTVGITIAAYLTYQYYYPTAAAPLLNSGLTADPEIPAISTNLSQAFDDDSLSVSTSGSIHNDAENFPNTPSYIYPANPSSNNNNNDSTSTSSGEVLNTAVTHNSNQNNQPALIETPSVISTSSSHKVIENIELVASSDTRAGTHSVSDQGTLRDVNLLLSQNDSSQAGNQDYTFNPYLMLNPMLNLPQNNTNENYSPLGLEELQAMLNTNKTTPQIPSMPRQVTFPTTNPYESFMNNSKLRSATQQSLQPTNNYRGQYRTNNKNDDLTSMVRDILPAAAKGLKQAAKYLP